MAAQHDSETPPQMGLGDATLAFDVAEDATRFDFDTDLVFDDGLPAYGSAFITQGYIYPAGTLGESGGVLPDGSPEYPDKVLGEWTCRGRFVGEGARSTGGIWLITTRLYRFGDGLDALLFVSE